MKKAESGTPGAVRWSGSERDAEVLTGRTKTPALPLRQSRRTGKAKRWHPPEKNGHEHGHSVSRGRDGQVQYRPKAPQWKGHGPGNGKTDAVSGQARVPIASQFRPQTGTTKKAGKKQRMESSSPDFDKESVIGPPRASGGGG